MKKQNITIKQLLRKKLTIHFYLLFAGIIVLTIISSVFYIKHETTKELKNSLNDIISGAEQSADYEICYHLLTAKDMVLHEEGKYIIQDALTCDFLKKCCSNKSEEIVNLLVVIDSDGKILASSEEAFLKNNISYLPNGEDFFNSFSDKKNQILYLDSTIYLNKKIKNYTAVKLDENRYLVAGRVTEKVEFETLYYLNIIASTRNQKNQRSYVFNDSKNPKIEEAIEKSENKMFLCTYYDKKHVAMLKKYDERYSVVAMISIFNLLKDVLWLLIIELFLLILSFTVLYYSVMKIMSKHIIGNISLVLDAIHNLSTGQITEGVQVDDTIEFKQLSDDINALFDILTDLKIKAQIETRTKSMFLANMSHEIRTPMNAVIGLSELALDLDLSDQARNYLQQIKSSGTSLLQIINDILDFSKIESGKMQIVPVEYDFFRFLHEVSNVILVRIGEKEVNLLVQIDPDLPSVFKGDDVRLRQIFLNIAGNATKYTDEGHITLRVQNLKKINGKDGIKVSIQDTGTGIKPEDLDKLFGAFEQVDMKVTRSKGGTGLGLSITKNLLKLMGGNITVESEYGKGSTFIMEIPQQVIEEKTVSQSYSAIFAKAEKSADYPDLALFDVEKVLNLSEFAGCFAEKTNSVLFKAPDAKILVVDDNEVNLQVAKGLLQKFSVQIFTAKSGWECLERVIDKKEQFDIVFMDHMMPGLDGVETVKRLREAEKSNSEISPFSHKIYVALSANAANGAREMFLKNGFDDFVSKPVQGKDFGSCLQKWLKSDLIKMLSEKESVSLQNENQLPPDFPQIDSERLDLSEAIENSGGFESWLKTVKEFYKSINSSYANIEKFWREKDVNNYTIQVHALKSAARIIGALKLSAFAEKLETCGKLVRDKKKLEAWTLIDEQTEKFLTYYLSFEKALKEIAKYGEISEKTEKSRVTKEQFDEFVKNLTEYSSLQQLEEIESLVKKMDAFSYPDSVQALVEQIKGAVENIDFDQLNDLAQRLQFEDI